LDGEPYRPLGRRAQIVTILPIIGIGTAIAGIVSGAMERSLLDDVQQGRFITPKQADENDRRQPIVAVVDGSVFIATGVFLFWFHRAYRNLRPRRRTALRHRMQSAAGSSWARFTGPR
jgi:hypothetical protein